MFSIIKSARWARRWLMLVDVNGIRDTSKLTRLEDVTPLMNSIIESCKLNVVGMCSHQFQPIGCTLLYLLAESHFSIHTFPERGSCSIDLFTCNLETDFDSVLEEIYHFFGEPIIFKRIYNR